MKSEPSWICSKLDKSSDILKCLPDYLHLMGGKHKSRGNYMMSQPFDTPDPQKFAQEFSHKLIELAETDEEVKEILSEVTGIELKQLYSMNTWNISFPDFPDFTFR
ncbi:hypothetical protein [Pseudanabaena yagii]|uniref:Uncharacterized protein n=1 Tax=Pseudanabaena yagii GIHE-NHR1 TaxID=2722753 RepID=A0ABX1LTN0_9CYAN|nr:hypothetical protein [Pseudanabaena yagii]NMF59479.1 hypothetical protein [Pseudanabaena yagii GIHE-NHR1]